MCRQSISLCPPTPDPQAAHPGGQESEEKARDSTQTKAWQCSTAGDKTLPKINSPANPKSTICQTCETVANGATPLWDTVQMAEGCHWVFARSLWSLYCMLLGRCIPMCYSYKKGDFNATGYSTYKEAKRTEHIATKMAQLAPWEENLHMSAWKLFLCV